MTNPRNIPRRDFLKATAASAMAAALSSRWPRAFAINRQNELPNILWIMSDEHNASVLGSYGDKIARTPHMDSLAEVGIAFDRCYCNSPLCSPSRGSLTAGKYASRVGMWNNFCELPSADIPSLPRVLNAAGYESYLCGKQHYDYSRRYGFTEVGGNFNRNFKTGLGSRRNPDDLTQKHLSPRFSEFHPGNNGSSVRHDRRVTTGALDFLSKRSAGEKPFFLYVGYLAPHFPLIVPEQYWNHFKGKIPMPEIPPGYLDRLPLNYKHLRAGFEEIGVPPDTVRRGRELYYGLTEWVDNEIGKVLHTLRANPAIADNTVIIYASDHGENMGEHGMWWKNDMFDCSARVPLVVSWPKCWTGGQRRTQTCSILDLVQTVAAIGQGRTPDDWNGNSMLTWMDDKNTHWKDFAVSEYYAHNIASGYVMARTANWKYTYFTTIDDQHPSERTLFDVSSDPKEFHNLAADLRHQQLIAEFDKRIIQEIGEAPDKTEQRARRELKNGYHRTDKRPDV
ncbi:MAG TPA: sulfatase-like hydrolase/transferase [Tepidisphaeraceae bacterium]|nr:sulfatase-like hydrolase/transferase [Tepidisphaeraceae bacterium]